jgi:hypothetical protein
MLASGVDPTLDIGFIETEDLKRPELKLEQFCSDRITGGMIHIVGHPTCLIKRDAG